MKKVLFEGVSFAGRQVELLWQRKVQLICCGQFEFLVFIVFYGQVAKPRLQSFRIKTVVLVPKKAINPNDVNEKKKHRLCTDFRKINEITNTDSYPLPNTQDALDSLGQAKQFSILGQK